MSRDWPGISKHQLLEWNINFNIKIEIPKNLKITTSEEHMARTNHLKTKPTKWLCAQQRQISLGFRPVWSESSLCTQQVAKDPSFLHADSEDWSDWADAQADLSLCWAHMPFVGFIMRQLIFWGNVILTCGVKFFNTREVDTLIEPIDTET